jgi:hypothetical protein
MQTIEQKRYRVDRIAPNEKKTFEINVPPRATSLKITLSWTDTAAAVNAQKALVNDVDIRLRLPATDETWQPWVLNKFPDSDSLSAPAKRGIDTLNNIEQITINDPADGLYTFEVNGTSIKTTGQDFAFAYQVDTADSFQWTFPTKSDPVLSGRRTVLRWETTIDEKADLEYTVNGTDWQRIATGVDLTNEHYSWDVPLEDTLVQLRAVLKTTNRVYSSDSIILSQPVRLRVGYYCADSVLLYWNRTSAATQLYTLGDLYMQPLLRTSDTMVILHRQQHPSLYYATAPVIAGQEGSRSQTLNYQLQGVGCYFTNFLAQLQDNHAILSTQLGTTYSITEIQFQKLTPAGYRTIKSLRPLSTSLAYNDSSLTAGMNVYRAQIILQNGQLITSEPQTIYYFPKLPVIVFPNPGRQNEPIQIIVADRDEYTIQLFDILGRLVHEQKLTLDLQTISKFHLGKGVYLIKIMNNQGVRFTEKLIIY